METWPRIISLLLRVYSYSLDTRGIIKFEGNTFDTLARGWTRFRRAEYFECKGGFVFRRLNRLRFSFSERACLNASFDPRSESITRN